MCETACKATENGKTSPVERWEGLVWDIFDIVPTDYNWGAYLRQDICNLIDEAVKADSKNCRCHQEG